MITDSTQKAETRRMKFLVEIDAIIEAPIDTLSWDIYPLLHPDQFIFEDAKGKILIHTITDYEVLNHTTIARFPIET